MRKRRGAIRVALLLLTGAVAASLWFGKTPQAVVDHTKIDLDRMIDFPQHATPRTSEAPRAGTLRFSDTF